jgi:hypothetical protein
MSLMDIESKRLRPNDLSMRHFLGVIEQSKSSVGPEDLTAQEDWTEQFGQEG